MMPLPHLCPECQGERITHDPTGFRWRHTNTCTVRASEDARLAADCDRAQWAPFTREVTASERLLLDACGFPLAADAVDVDGLVVTRNVEVAISLPSAGMRHRAFFERWTNDRWRRVDAAPPNGPPPPFDPAPTTPTGA